MQAKVEKMLEGRVVSSSRLRRRAGAVPMKLSARDRRGEKGRVGLGALGVGGCGWVGGQGRACGRMALGGCTPPFTCLIASCACC